MIQLEVKNLHRKVHEGVRREGHHYFTKDSLLDAFSLSPSKDDYKTAVRNLLAFNKELSKKKLQLMRVGFVRLSPSEVNPELMTQTQGKRRLERVELMLGGVLTSPEEHKEETYMGFTYIVQSLKHENQPLLVTEQFALDYPLLALASFTAEIWNNAYQTTPRSEIEQIARGM